jgi:hypothetical protein
MEITQDILFKYLDIIIIEAKIAEPDSSKNILHEKYLNPISDKERDEYFEICDKVVSLGSKLGFLKNISKENDWFELTEKGILAKSKNGYFKYIDFIEKRELEKVKPTIVAEKYIGGDNYENISSKNLNINSNNPTTNNAIPNAKNESQTNSIILKFWKLISENKLVSGFKLVLILWIIKKYFNIDFKI